MNEKRFIPGTKPEWGRELPDEDDNSLLDKHGNNYDNGYNFDERDNEVTYDNLAKKQPFEPEEAKRRQEEAKQAFTNENAA